MMFRRRSFPRDPSDHPGTELVVLDPVRPNREPEVLVDAGKGWIGCAMSASHDGHTLYFCMAPQEHPFFHIYSISTSGGEPTHNEGFSDHFPIVTTIGTL